VNVYRMMSQVGVGLQSRGQTIARISYDYLST
jgi:hypothetical protein